MSISISKAKKTLKENKEKENNENNEKKKVYDPLFDNPMIQQIKDGMSKEDREHYEKVGKELYDSINFETMGTENDDTINEVLMQLRIMIESGMHPSYLTYEEKNFLVHYMGKEWYKEFGYLENDVNRINL